MPDSPEQRLGDGRGSIALTVEHNGDALVRLSGHLREQDTGDVARKLAGLMMNGDCVFVDIDRLTLEHPASLAVFTQALAEAGGWPMSKLAVISTSRFLRRALRETGVARLVMVSRSLKQARARRHRRPPEVRASWSFEPIARAPRHARRYVETRLRLWGYSVTAITPVLQVTSELVTNAVLHAATAMRLDLILDQHGLRCSVRDFSTAVPTTTARSGTVGGYGMRIVEGFAQQWGFLVHPDGKTIWARFERPHQAVASW